MCIFSISSQDFRPLFWKTPGLLSSQIKLLGNGTIEVKQRSNTGCLSLLGTSVCRGGEWGKDLPRTTTVVLVFFSLLWHRWQVSVTCTSLSVSLKCCSPLLFLTISVHLWRLNWSGMSARKTQCLCPTWMKMLPTCQIWEVPNLMGKAAHTRRQ